VCDEGEVYGSGHVLLSRSSDTLKEYSRVHTTTTSEACTVLLESPTIRPFPLLVVDSTVIALDRQCLGLRRRPPGAARGCVDWRLEEPAGPGGSGGSHWVQVVSEV
jgi:hypothetical protein